MSKHPIFKVSAGLLMGVAGGIMLISSTVIVTNNAGVISDYFGERPDASDLTALPTVSVEQCVTHINSIGLSATQSEEGEVVVAPEGIADTEMPAERASLTANACPGFDLSYFCLGQECEGGMEMRLSAN